MATNLSRPNVPRQWPWAFETILMKGEGRGKRQKAWKCRGYAETAAKQQHRVQKGATSQHVSSGQEVKVHHLYLFVSRGQQMVTKVTGQTNTLLGQHSAQIKPYWSMPLCMIALLQSTGRVYKMLSPYNVETGYHLLFNICREIKGVGENSNK